MARRLVEVGDRRRRRTAAVSGLPLGGPDVSDHQGEIDWPAVRGDGFELAFAIAKATEGAHVGDATFARNWHGIRARGLLRGAYHFARPSAASDPAGQAEEQARHFLDAVDAEGGLHPGDLPAVLDLETTDGLLGAGLHAWVGAWAATVHRHTGRLPIIYTNAFWTNAMPAHAGAFGCRLWIADWGVREPRVPPPWTRWALWQTSSTGRLPGISTAVDLNRFNGTRAELEGLAAAGDASPARHHPAGQPSVVPPRWPGSPLREGTTRGAAVRAWQERVRDRGFTTLATDGRFGPRTRQACEWLQLYLELPVTGVVDERTWEATWTAP
jgi:lysozyme